MSSQHTTGVDDPDSAINDGEHGPETAPGNVLEHDVQRPLLPMRSPRAHENHTLTPISTRSANLSIASTHPLAIFFGPETIPRPTVPIPDSPPTDRDTTHIPNRPILTKEPGPAKPGLFISLDPKAMSGVDILTFNAIYGRKPENHAPLLIESKARPAEEYLPTKAYISTGAPNAYGKATQDAMHPKHKLNTFGPEMSENQKNPVTSLAPSFQAPKKHPPRDDSIQAVAKQAPKSGTNKTKMTKRLINPADEAARYEAGSENRARVYANLFSNANRFLNAIKAPDGTGAQTPKDQLFHQHLPFGGLLGTPQERSNSKDSNATAEGIDRTLKKLSKLMNAAPPEDRVSNPALESPHVVNSPHIVDTPHLPSTNASFSNPTSKLPPKIPFAHAPNAIHPFTARSLLTAWLKGGSYADMASPGCTEHGDPDHRPRECKRCRRQIRILEEWKTNESVGGYKQQEGRRWVMKWMLEKWGVECEVKVEGEKVFRKSGGM